MVSLRDFVRSITERPRLYLGLLLVLLVAFVLYLLVTGMLVSFIPALKQKVLLGFLVLAILGILAGVLLAKVETFKAFYRELETEHPLIVIVSGALLFALLGVLYTIYSATVGGFSIFESVPLFTITLADLAYKIVVSFVNYFLHGIVVVGSLLLGARIGT